MTITKPEPTTVEDLEQGWTKGDWANHTRLEQTVDGEPQVCYIENWRFQLSRPLTSQERKAWQEVAETTFDPETQQYSLDKTLRYLWGLTTLTCQLRRLRVGDVEAISIDAEGFTYELPPIQITEDSNANG